MPALPFEEGDTVKVKSGPHQGDVGKITQVRFDKVNGREFFIQGTDDEWGLGYGTWFWTPALNCKAPDS